MSQIIHGPPKIWGPGQLPDLPPLKPALGITKLRCMHRECYIFAPQNL